MNRDAPVAQLDRALPSEGKGHTFESCRVRHIYQDFFDVKRFWSIYRKRIGSTAQPTLRMKISLARGEIAAASRIRELGFGRGQSMSALKRITDSGRTSRKVRKVPATDSCSAANRIFRGRDASYLAPPAQIRTCGFPAYGSHLGYRRQ